MVIKELSILKLFLNELLNENEQRELLLLIGSEEGYNNFLIKLLEILLKKENSGTIDDFLDIHRLSLKKAEILNKTKDIIEGIAELNFKGYNSDYTKLLSDKNNHVFYNHLGFLKETRAAISINERALIKIKLAELGKDNDIEISESEIKAGIKTIVRAQLKSRFNKLYEAEIGIPTLKSKKLNFKYSTVFLFIIITSIAFAFANPTLRHFLISHYHKLIDKPKTEHSHKDTNVVHMKIFGPWTDKDSVRILSIDTTESKIKSKIQIPNTHLNSNTKITETDLVISKNKDYTSKPIHNSIEGIEIVKLFETEKDFTDYFKNNAGKSSAIEGIWVLYIRNKINYEEGFKIKCAIYQLEKNKFEIIHFNWDGTLLSTPNIYYLESRSAAGNMKYSIRNKDNRKIYSSKANIQINADILFFESEYPAVYANKKNKKGNILCKVSAYKKVM